MSKLASDKFPNVIAALKEVEDYERIIPVMEYDEDEGVWKIYKKLKGGFVLLIATRVLYYEASRLLDQIVEKYNLTDKEND